MAKNKYFFDKEVRMMRMLKVILRVIGVGRIQQ